MNYNILKTITEDGWHIASLPEEERTAEMCRAAIQSAIPKLSDSESILRYVPKPLRTPELCMLAVARDGGALRDVPLELQKRDICLTAVKNYWNALGNVPVAFQDEELCGAAVEENGQALQFVPHALVTSALIWRALKTAPAALQFVPLELRTAEICLYAYRRDNTGLVARFIPTEILNELFW